MARTKQSVLIEDRVDIEKLWSFYCSHSREDTCKEFNISSGTLRRLLLKHNLVKSKDDIKSTIQKGMQANPKVKSKEELDLEEEIYQYSLSHSYPETIKHFKIGSAKITRIRKEKGIMPISSPKKRVDKALEKFIESHSMEEFKNFYLSHTTKDTLTKYKIGTTTLKKLLEHWEIPCLTARQGYENSLINKYGSLEEGNKIIAQKVISNTDYQARNEITKERHGFISPFELEATREKAKATCQAKYGVDNVFQSAEFQKLCHENQKQKYNGVGFASELIREKYNSVMQDTYGVDWACLLPQCIEKSNGSNSGPNVKFQKLLYKYFNEFKSEVVLNHFRYDFNIQNILFEINPSYTHSPSIEYRGNKAINKSYHLNKTKTAREHGYRCIHIWDWDDQEKIVKSLLPKTPIYARKCEIKEVPKDICDQFLNEYHFQNTCRGQSIRYGLYYNDELIQIMTFGKPRYNKNYDYELLRLCTKNEYRVIGGSKKLFSQFLKNYPDASIISYCDNSKFLGDVYLSLGMKLKDEGKPTRHWYHPRLGIHVTDNFLRQRGFDQLFGDIFGTYGKGTSNEELMLLHEFVDIYDCGQSSYIWNNNI